MHLSAEALRAGREHVLGAPVDHGRLEIIVARPDLAQRAVLAEAEIDIRQGLVGDNWETRGSRHRPDGTADPDKQVTVMNVRVAALVAAAEERIPLAGDQLYVDLELGVDNLPVGTDLEIGSAVLRVTAPPHTGCKKFVARFGAEAMRFVNSAEGRAHRWRGMNATVVRSGTVRVGDAIVVRRVVSPPGLPEQPTSAAVARPVDATR